jgi:hypothetical protein
VLQKPKFFEADWSRLDAGECEVASLVPSEIVVSFVKMVEGKPIVITNNGFLALLVLSDEFGFHELSDACQECADARLFRIPAEQRSASESCAQSGLGIHQTWIGAAEFHHFSAEQGNAQGQGNFGRCLEYGFGVAQDLTGQPNSIASLLNRGMRMPSPTSGAV